jgi:hypothetical protein
VPVPRRRSAQHRSIVYAVLLISAMLVMLLGAVTAAVGAASTSTTEVSFLGAHIKTTSTGLVLVVVGAAFAATLVLKKPPEIDLFSPQSASRRRLDQVLQAVLPAAILIGSVGAVLLVISVVRS